MQIRVNVIAIVLWAAAAASAQTTSQPIEDRAAQALKLARDGNHAQAIEIYRDLITREPDNMPVLRDFAIVLSWAERYNEAAPLVRNIWKTEIDQPDWALRDFGLILLFGDALEDAVTVYDKLIDRGDRTEQTLLRRSLALRWLGRSKEAYAAYEGVLDTHPESSSALAGLAYTLADNGGLADALKRLDASGSVSPRAPEVLKAKIRILNWAGRHYEAQRLIASLPESMKDDREILEDRVSAERWGGNPSGAMRQARRLITLFPAESNQRLARDLRMEYGHSFGPGFRFGKDSDGLVDRSAGIGGTVHLAPAHAIQIGYQYRWQQQREDVRTLIRYELGWGGNVGSRTALYAKVGNVDYRLNGVDRKFVGDGSIDFAVNDRIRLAGGGGVIAMDAYQSLPEQVTGRFGFADLSLQPFWGSRLQGRYSRYAFSNDVYRDRLSVEFTQTLTGESRVRLKAGGRTGYMRHNMETGAFFSPSTFQSHLAVAQAYGPLTSWLDFSSEAAAGWQYEPGIPALHPFQLSGALTFHPSRFWRLTVDGGKSTSSIDRVLPGRQAYSRWAASASMEFRFP